MALNLMMTEDDELRPRITVFGVGGAGGNAVNNMIDQQLEGVEFVVANTDAQALAQSRARSRIQIGPKKTEGLGAGANPAIGAAAAEETIEDIVDHLMGAHMCFITAGMGGGTGTGAAPIIAQAAREMGILTVGVVTKPFQFEGVKRMRQADAGIEALQKVVDTLIVIPNQNLFRLANEKTTFTDAFAMADDVLHQGVKGVTDLMVRPGLINLDFADVRAVMDEMGKAMMGAGEATGENRAVQAAEKAIANPLLDEISLHGAKGVLINITAGYDLTLFELDEAANIIREKVDADANIIVGSTLDETMEGALRVSVVATGIDAEPAAAEVPHPRRSMSAPLTQNPSVTQKEQPAPAARPAVAEEDDLPVPPRRVAPTADPRVLAASRAHEDEGMPEPAYRPAPEQRQDLRPATARLGDDAASFTAPARPAGQPAPQMLDRVSNAVNRAAARAPSFDPRGQRAPEQAPQAAPAAGRMGGLARMLERMSGHAEGGAKPSSATLADRISERVAHRRSTQDEFDGIDEPARDDDPVEIPAFLRRQAN
ncbi:cell division protein FtsZ [Paracoccus sp. S-4012]|uniref:cell division protein FtsZ n=1 Tax=Paracoccus sp. S-4012 TaxID=2665648 RepID=UPI0012B0C25B|nr:cell division protein FtsZ [Paracoccus sp. S-4012]MRX49053.1 cell division protein FtsZ [Paracoccus sp. S-4012]